MISFVSKINAFMHKCGMRISVYVNVFLSPMQCGASDSTLIYCASWFDLHENTLTHISEI